MSRIRTIKPDFFRHAGLFDAERETGLPLRVAFAGLWTAADREGRFRWRPRELKLDALPFDDVDFSRVLDALTTRGFVVRYRRTSEVGGVDYGFIPSWRKHQVINHRERQSNLPDPEDCEIFQEDTDASLTREPRVPHAGTIMPGHARGEGEGEQEGEGKYPDRESTSLHTAGFEKKPAAGRKANGQAAGARYPAWFEAIWIAYRPIASPNSSKSRALTAAKRLSEKDRESCRAGLAGYVAWLRKERAKRSDYPAQHLATFINGRGWEAFSQQNAQTAPAVSDAELQRIVDTINAEREREEQADDLAAH